MFLMLYATKMIVFRLKTTRKKKKLIRVFPPQLEKLHFCGNENHPKIEYNFRPRERKIIQFQFYSFLCTQRNTV